MHASHHKQPLCCAVCPTITHAYCQESPISHHPTPLQTSNGFGVITGLLVGVVAAMHIGKLPPALPALRAEFALTLTQSGWIVSAFNTLGLVASLFMGFASARLGAWRQCVLAMVLLALGGVMGAAASSAAWLMVSRFVEGTGFLAAVVAAPGLILQSAAPAAQRRALGLWGGYMPTGTTLGMLLAPLLIAKLGWRSLWVAEVLFALTVLALLLWQRRAFAIRSPAKQAAGTLWATAAPPLMRPGPWWIAFAFACYVFNFYAIMVWLPMFLVGERQLPLAQASLLTAAMVLANLPGNLVGGWLLHKGFARGTNVACAGVATLLTAMVIFSPQWPDLVRYAACVAFSFTVGVLPGSIMSAAHTHARNPQQAGMVQGMINQGSNLGQFSSPFVVSAVVGVGMAWERVQGLFWVTGLLIIASGLVLRRVEQRLQAHPL